VIEAYRGATLLEGTGAPARTGTTILVEGEHIRLIAPDAEVPAELLELAATTVELDGRHVIPGLIDSHQHIATPPDRPTAEATLARDLYGGVTATRDMADDLRHVADLARSALLGEIPAPDIHYAALMAGPGFFEDPRTRQVTQGAIAGQVPWMQAIEPDTDLALAVAMARGTYATAIKIYADLPGETVAAITAEAHRQGIAVWAHAAVFPATPAQVVRAGVDSVSHAHLLAYQTVAAELTTYGRKPPLAAERIIAGDPLIAELLAEMRARGTVLDATASLWARIARETGTAANAPGDDRGDGAGGSDGGGGAGLAAAHRRAVENDAISAALTRQALAAGVTVSAGTDRDPDLAEPWPPLYEELDYLVERCGMTPAQALRAAAHAGAVSLGAAGRMGTVEPGKLANFAILDEDPARDLAALRTLTAVVKRGRHHPRTDYRHPRPAAATPATTPAARAQPDAAQPENGAPAA
jgi:imidazolonepropionase-like amidohydrolase